MSWFGGVRRKSRPANNRSESIVALRGVAVSANQAANPKRSVPRRDESQAMSLVDTVKNAFVPIHKEGYPFIGAFAVVTLLFALFSINLFWIGLILTAWCAYFFRDPVRVTPTDDRLVVSPADGVVSSVGPGIPPRELGLGSGEMTRISVFMNVFSCHVNRAPVRGQDQQDRASPRKILQRRTRQGERGE